MPHKKKPVMGAQDTETDDTEVDTEVEEETDEVEDTETEESDEVDDGDSEADSDEEELSPEELKAELAKVRKALKERNAENAKRRKRLKELETEEAKRKTESLSEVDRLKKERDDANEALKTAKKDRRDALIQSAVEVEAGKMNFYNPAHVLGLLDLKEIEVDDATGKVKGVKPLLVALAKENTYLVKPVNREAPDINAEEGGRGDRVSVNAVLDKKRQEYGAL